MIASFLARLALGGLIKAGVSEGAAGAFAVSRWFKPVAGLALLGIAALLAWIGLVVHDRHLTQVVTIRCEAENLAKALGAENKSLKQAVEQSAETLRERGLTLLRNQNELKELKEKHDALRNQSPNPDRLLLPAADPWVRGLTGDAAHRPNERAGRSGPR